MTTPLLVRKSLVGYLALVGRVTLSMTELLATPRLENITSIKLVKFVVGRGNTMRSGCSSSMSSDT